MTAKICVRPLSSLLYEILALKEIIVSIFGLDAIRAIGGDNVNVLKFYLHHLHTIYSSGNTTK